MEEDFDVEKYRKERPMDYLSAYKFIIEPSHPSIKNEILNIIYKVTRLHIPDELFKYYSLTDDKELNELKLETLRDNKIHLADIKTLNDPYDSKGYFYRNEELLEFEELIEHDGKIIDNTMESHRLTSLTKCGFDNMKMWAEYSNNHKGYCVTYKMNEKQDISFKGNTFPVQYIDERLDITNLVKETTRKIINIKNENFKKGIKVTIIEDLTLPYVISLLNNLKTRDWETEEEFRCSVGNWKETDSKITAYPSAIYIGLNCSLSHIIKLISIAHQNNIPIFQMKNDRYSINGKLTAELLPI